MVSNLSFALGGDNPRYATASSALDVGLTVTIDSQSLRFLTFLEMHARENTIYLAESNILWLRINAYRAIRSLKNGGR